MKALYSFLLIPAFCIISSICFSQFSPSNKLDHRIIANLENSNYVDCLIRFTQKADLSATSTLKNKSEKTRFVFDALRKTSIQSQKEVLDYLSSRDISYSAFIVVNAVSAELDRQAIEFLQDLPEVKSIDLNPSVQLDFPIEDRPFKSNPDPEWGILKIEADSVWQMGYTGQDVVIAGQDTGYDWEHPTLMEKYRGWDGSSADHNYNWHDAIYEIDFLNGDTINDASLNPCGLQVPYPCDDHNHGTHTMGTMLGSDSLNLIGVAPDSRWIACRNMERGTGSPASYIECFEWFLAPTRLDGQFPDPNLAPDVINNSWSCPEIEGCNENNWDLMREAIINLKSAGIAVVVSAGNNGWSGCSSVSTAPAIFEESFTVGATMINDTIAGFSSKGPVSIDSSFRLKPDVSAPGFGVRSSIRNDAFAIFSGTSMAGPHVAGTIALMISANPELRGQVETIESILRQSTDILTDTISCIGAGPETHPNAIYGYGRINALRAVELSKQLSSSEYLEDELTRYTIFPNPSKGRINLHSDTYASEDKLNLFNIQGLSVFSGSMQPTLDLSHLPKGIYFLRIQADDRNEIHKIIIEE